MKQKINIAIIDDCDDIRYTLSQICKLQGWNCAEASNYFESLELMKGHVFDLFIVDYHLPEVDGVEVVKEARKRFPKAMILILTVEEKEKVVQRFLDAGANDYALKPIKAVDLISRINVHMKYKWIRDSNRDVNKGINFNTLTTIRNCMKKLDDFASAEHISKLAGISPQSAYRYFKYMLSEGMLKTRSVFGGGKGRPKTYYKINNTNLSP